MGTSLFLVFLTIILLIGSGVYCRVLINNKTIEEFNFKDYPRSEDQTRNILLCVHGVKANPNSVKPICEAYKKQFENNRKCRGKKITIAYLDWSSEADIAITDLASMERAADRIGVPFGELFMAQAIYFELVVGIAHSAGNYILARFTHRAHFNLYLAIDNPIYPVSAAYAIIESNDADVLNSFVCSEIGSRTSNTGILIKDIISRNPAWAHENCPIRIGEVLNQITDDTSGICFRSEWVMNSIPIIDRLYGVCDNSDKHEMCELSECVNIGNIYGNCYSRIINNTIIVSSVP